MKKLLVLCWVFAMSAVAGHAQRINFGLSAGDAGITVTNLGAENGVLDFNVVTNPIKPGTALITISLQQNALQVVPIQIEAAEHLDITVEVITPPNGLELVGHAGSGPAPTLPFQLGWAYWNQSQPLATVDLYSVQVMGNAREVQPATGANLGFSSATFPMRRRSDGTTPPPPPPTPAHGGMTQPNKAIAILYLYGSLGPVPTSASSGQYTGQIQVLVSYASYD
jgi:hypothetical protein